jgi:hypothetical protein
MGFKARPKNTNSKNISYEMTVMYDLSENDLFVADELIEDAVGRMSHSSGAGMGKRDLQWSFSTKDQRLQAASNVFHLKDQINGNMRIIFNDLNSEYESIHSEEYNETIH